MGRCNRRWHLLRRARSWMALQWARQPTPLDRTDYAWDQNGPARRSRRCHAPVPQPALSWAIAVDQPQRLAGDDGMSSVGAFFDGGLITPRQHRSPRRASRPCRASWLLQPACGTSRRLVPVRVLTHHLSCLLCPRLPVTTPVSRCRPATRTRARPLRVAFGLR